MNKRIALLLGGGLVAAAALGLGTNSVLATSATTWTVKPGGVVTGTGTGAGSLRDTTTGSVLTCTSSAAQATLKSGSGLAGKDIGSLTSVTYTGCTGPLGLAFTVKTSVSPTKPGKRNAISYNSATSVAKETITGISATISGPSCSATINGTSASGNNGMVAATYSNKTATMTISKTGGNLHVYNVSGCAGLINNGDSAQLTGSYKVSPGQVITSP